MRWSKSRRVLFMAAVSLMVQSCDNAPNRAATGSASSSLATGRAVGKHSGIEVLRSSVPKVTEAQFSAALDKRLQSISEELGSKQYRSRMHLAAELGQRMQAQRIVQEVSKNMGVSDVSVLSLFARNPEVRASVGKRVKQHADDAGKKLMASNDGLPMVVKQDCREAAARGLLLREVAAGKRPASQGDRAAAPMVGAVIKECRTAAEQVPEMKCYVDAKDAAELKTCP